MTVERGAIDDLVLDCLHATTLGGRRPVMTPSQIGRHIGLATDGGWGPSPQQVAWALKRLAARGLVERVGQSRTSWTTTRQ